MSSFDTYMKSVTDKPTAYIGELVWYAVQNTTRISHTDFVQNLTAAGLDAYTPKPPRDDDTFARVTSDIARKREPVPGQTDVFENFLVRKVRHENGNIIKHIVVETVDAGNKRLQYGDQTSSNPAAVELDFHSANAGAAGEFSINPLGWPTNDRAVQLAREARDSFLHWRGHVHADTVRTFINKVVTRANATLVKTTGGIYFVTNANTHQLDRLDAAIHGITGVQVHRVPLVDTTNQREMVREAFVNETVGEVNRLTREMNELLEGEEITPERFNAYQRQIAELKAKTKEYEDLLGSNLEAAELHLTSLEKARGRLMWHQRTK